MKFTVVYNRCIIGNAYVATCRYFTAVSLSALEKHIGDRGYDYQYILRGFVEPVDKEMFEYLKKTQVDIL